MLAFSSKSFDDAYHTSTAASDDKCHNLWAASPTYYGLSIMITSLAVAPASTSQVYPVVKITLNRIIQACFSLFGDPDGQD